MLNAPLAKPPLPLIPGKAVIPPVKMIQPIQPKKF
jgi:hypothetical protein